MATTPTNSNGLNIADLPQAQLASDLDLLILETQNGTQTIQFNNFNVVRTDVAGNATVVGDISGNNAIYGNVRTGVLRAGVIYSNNQQGVTKSNAYQNILQTTNGIIVSSDYVIGSPEYIELRNLYNSLSGNSSQDYKKVYEYNGIAEITADQIDSSVINIGQFPRASNGLSVGSLIGNNVNYASFFTLTPFARNGFATSSVAPALGNFSYNPGSGNGDDFILVNVRLADVNSRTVSTFVGVRLLFFYN
jgi:hypothetical protein